MSKGTAQATAGNGVTPLTANGPDTTSPAPEVVDTTAAHPGLIGATSALGSEPPWFRRRGALVVAIALATVMVLIAVAALAGDDTPDTAATGSEATDPTVSEPAATDNAAADTTAAPPSTGAVVTLGELADRIAADPDSFGEKGSDLLSKLQEVQREKPDKQADKASKVLEEIDKWIAEGKLNSSIAKDAQAVLQPIAHS